MDEQQKLALFRAYLTKLAQTKGRWVLDAAAGGRAEHMQLVKEGASYHLLDALVRDLNALDKNPEEFGKSHGLIAPKEQQP